MNVTEMDSEQTSGYQRGEGRREGHRGDRGLRGTQLRDTNYYVQNKLQGCVVQTRGIANIL